MRKDYEYRREEQKEYQLKRYHSFTPEQKLNKRKLSDMCRIKLRKDVLDILGGECSWCGAKENLEIDHIKSNGTHDLAPNGKRVSGYASNLRVKKHNNPKEEYQILCKTCNIRKHQNSPYILTKELMKLGYTAIQIDDLIKQEVNI